MFHWKTFRLLCVQFCKVPPNCFHLSLKKKKKNNHSIMMFSWSGGTKRSSLAHIRKSFLQLTCLPPKNRRWRRSRSATLWDPWRTRPRRCWACPGRWADPLPSPIPGTEESKWEGKRMVGMRAIGVRGTEETVTNFLKVGWRRAGGWGGNVWVAATQGGRQGVRGA